MCELRERLSGNADASVSSGDGYTNDNDSDSSMQTLVEEPLISMREEERQHAAAPSPNSLSSPLSSLSSSPLGTSPDKREDGLHNHVQDSTLCEYLLRKH